MEDKNEEFWDLLSFLQMSKNRKQAIRIISKSEWPLMPKEVTDGMDTGFNSVSRAMRELEQRNLLKCVNPDAPHHRRYMLTKKGEEVLKVLEEIEDNE